MASAKERVIQINQRINALGRERRLSEALALLPYLRSQGLRPTAVTYNVLLSACTRCSDNVGAAKLLKEMAGEGLKPNIITYATVAKGLCLAGELQQADDVLSAAEKGGVEPNDRICTAFLRGCLVWGEVDRVRPFLRRMAQWNVTLSASAVEYAARALCMGLRALEAEEIVMAASATSSSDASTDSSTAALHLALAEAHVALRDWPKARDRISRAQARIATGLDARLHDDRDRDRDDTAAFEGGSNNQAMMATFLRHREAENKAEAQRLAALVAEGSGEAMEVGEASDSGKATADAPAKKRRKRDDGRDGRPPPPASPTAAAAPRESWKAYLRRMEGVYRRVLLLSPSTAKLACTPLDAAGAAAPTYGKTPKALRRWRLAALLMTRLDRVGLGRLQQVCVGRGVVGDADGGALGAKSERRVLKAIKRACSAACHVRWAKIFGNGMPIRLEVCAGAGEWAFAQARAHPDVNWVASELRGDRIHQNVARLRAARDAPANLAILGGDAAIALRHHTRRASLDAVYVNYPEPPSDHTDEGAYLLNEPFFRDVHAALTPGGHGLVIVTDNPILLETCAKVLVRLMRGGGGGGAAEERQPGLSFTPRTGVEAGRPRVVGVTGVGAAGAAIMSEGVPEGFGAEGTSSWFDRLWASRQHHRRFYIHLERAAA